LPKIKFIENEADILSSQFLVGFSFFSLYPPHQF